MCTPVNAPVCFPAVARSRRMISAQTCSGSSRSRSAMSAAVRVTDAVVSYQ
jgi:hypothetical protein